MSNLQTVVLSAEEIMIALNKAKDQDDQHVLESIVDHVKKIVTSLALQESRGNQSHAANLLGISRGQLKSIIVKHGL